MEFQATFRVKTKEHPIQAVKTFWQSRSFKVKSELPNSLQLTRGEIGYGKKGGLGFSNFAVTGSNPLKYHFELQIDSSAENDDLFITCHARTETDELRNVLRDILIKSEFSKFEKYMQDFSEGMPSHLRNLSEVEIKTTTSQYFLNIIPGLGLLFCGHKTGAAFGVAGIVASILEIISTYNIEYEPSFLLFVSTFWYIVFMGAIGAYFVGLGNYERIYDFDNEQ